MANGLSADRGLTSQNSILQDREGFIWIGSFYGLHRLDGHSVKVFRFDPNDAGSLGNNLIPTLCQADDGSIWAGSGDGGIYIFDPLTEKFTVLLHDPNDPSSLCGHGINFLAKDREGDIWVGTRFNGVCRWSKKTGRFESFEGQIPEGKAFFQQKNGAVWIGSSKGLYRKADREDRFFRIEDQPGCSGGEIYQANDICELPDGHLLVTSGRDGFWKLDPSTNLYSNFDAFSSESSPSPNYFLEDASGQIWMTGEGEIHRYDPFSEMFSVFPHQNDVPTSCAPFSIMFPYQDRAGSLWFMTSGGGIQVAHAIRNPFEKMSDRPGYLFQPLSEKQMLSAFDGIEIFDVTTGAKVDIGLPPEIARMRPNEITLSGQELWISEWTLSTQRLVVFHLETKQVRNLPFCPAGGGLVVDAGGEVWNGLHTFDANNNVWISRVAELEAAVPGFVAKQMRAIDLCFDDRDRMWIGTNLGIFVYDRKNGIGKNYRRQIGVEGSLNSDDIFAVFPGSEGRIYATSVNGLNVYDPASDRFSCFDPNNGLLHLQVSSVVEDETGNPWVATPRGLQKLDLASGTFTNYGAADGLANDRFEIHRAARDSRGYLYFSQARNVIRFHPDSLRKNQYAAPVYLMDLFLEHSAVKANTAANSPLKRQLRYTEDLELQYNQSNFGFSFVMPLFNQAESTEYFYRLSPYEKEWKSAGNDREVHYTNISPGRYQFSVMARTAAGIWSPNEASVRIRIFPPWWNTRLAYVLYALAAAVALFCMRHYELRRQLAKAEAHRLRELDSLKTRLYTNITHEFRTPLTVIMGLTNQLATGKWQSSLPYLERDNLQQSFSLIRRNSKNLLRLINQLLDLSKLDSGAMQLNMVRSDVISYLKYLSESFLSMAEEKRINLSFLSEIDELPMDYDEIKLQHVIYNLLSNAIKFTEENGRIELTTKLVEKNNVPHLNIKVQDTGIGIAERDLTHIFDRFYQVDQSSTRKAEGTGIGLALTRELIILMGGEISVWSSPGQGTAFTILLPVRRDLGSPLHEKEFPVEKVLVPDLAADGAGGISSEKKELTSFGPKPLRQNKDRLLLIEDNRDVAFYIETLLTDQYRIERAENGQLGIEIAFETMPDIIISDVMMPEKDGYQVCEILKKDERTSHIPIILLTARSTQEAKITGLQAGADAYLVKPFNQKELFVRLEKLTALRRTLQLKYGAEEALAMGVKTKDKAPTLDERFLERLREIVENRIADSEFGVSELSRAANLSHAQLFRKLKALTDKSPSVFIRTIRLYKAKYLLENTEMNVSEIAYEVGFSDPNYFSRTFSEQFGVSPTSTRKQS